MAFFWIILEKGLEDMKMLLAYSMEAVPYYESHDVDSLVEGLDASGDL